MKNDIKNFHNKDRKTNIIDILIPMSLLGTLNYKIISRRLLKKALTVFYLSTST